MDTLRKCCRIKNKEGRYNVSTECNSPSFWYKINWTLIFFYCRFAPFLHTFQIRNQFKTNSVCLVKATSVRCLQQCTRLSYGPHVTKENFKAQKHDLQKKSNAVWVKLISQTSMNPAEGLKHEVLMRELTGRPQLIQHLLQNTRLLTLSGNINTIMINSGEVKSYNVLSTFLCMEGLLRTLKYSSHRP